MPFRASFVSMSMPSSFGLSLLLCFVAINVKGFVCDTKVKRPTVFYNTFFVFMVQRLSGCFTASFGRLIPFS